MLQKHYRFAKRSRIKFHAIRHNNPLHNQRIVIDSALHSFVTLSFTRLPWGKDAKRYQVREFLDMVEEFGLKLDE
jgi:hypothetical protein